MLALVIVALMLGGLAATLWGQQRRLIYFPTRGPVPSATTIARDAQDVVLETADGLRLGAWYLPGPGPTASPGPAILVCNGNGGDRSGRAPLALALRRAGFSVLLFDYRGYGENPGNPTEKGLALDAAAARAWLVSRPEVDPRRVVYFGESLGGAVSLRLALEHPPAALVLRSPFTSLADAGRVHYPYLPLRLLLLDRYPSIDRIGDLKAPLLIIAGDRDSVVPDTLSRRLFDAAAEPKRFVLIAGADHNDRELLDGAELIGETLGFLREHSVR
ncbi:alpha/beta hydrolase [Mycobacterium intermedium]